MTEQNPEPRTTRLTANGITIELDLNQVLTALDPAGSYRGYNPDTDEDCFEPSSLETQLVDATATLLVKSLRKDIRDLVAKETATAIKTEVETIVRETLDGPVQPVSEWGSPSGQPSPLRDLIGAQAQAALKKPELRDGYSRGQSKTMVQRIIDAEIEGAFKKELAEVVAQAKAEALEAVKNKAAEVITETIQRATRGI